MYDKLVMKVKVIDNNGFLLKTQYNTDKSGLEKKIDDADKKYLMLVGLLKKLRSLRLKLKYLLLLAQLLLLPLMLLKIRYLTSGIYSKRQIIMLKYQTLYVNILPHLIIMDLRMK